VTTPLKAGDKVLAARTTVKPAHVRSKTGEQVPEKVVTKLREGKLRVSTRNGWLVEWHDAANRRRTECYFSHEITKLGTNPLVVSDK
jgi:hypothetical protein